jgi:hypothetical protein
VGAAPLSHGEDVGEVAAEPMELGDGKPVARSCVAGELAEPRAFDSVFDAAEVSAKSAVE